jgi:myo-inositol-1(or 4)-monophosphatase
VISYLDAAAEIARESGGLLVTYFERKVAFEYKGEHDLVTVADRASEALVVERLRSHFPSHSIVAEEGGGYETGGEFRWYVDPLDGTTNFAHGFPMFNVTLALEQRGDLIAGVVFDPLRNEMFSAERGSGAYLNGRRMAVSSAARLEDSLVATGFPNRRRHANTNVHYYHQLAMASHGVRRAGAAALDLAYVAAGRLDGFWEFGLSPWDMAAGKLLVEEAGGACSSMDGSPHTLASADLLADNGKIHSAMIEIFGEVARGNYRAPLPVLT